MDDKLTCLYIIDVPHRGVPTIWQRDSREAIITQFAGRALDWQIDSDVDHPLHDYDDDDDNHRDDYDIEYNDMLDSITFDDVIAYLGHDLHWLYVIETRLDLDSFIAGCRGLGARLHGMPRLLTLAEHILEQINQ